MVECTAYTLQHEARSHTKKWIELNLYNIVPWNEETLFMFVSKLLKHSAHPTVQYSNIHYKVKQFTYQHRIRIRIHLWNTFVDFRSYAKKGCKIDGSLCVESRTLFFKLFLLIIFWRIIWWLKSIGGYSRSWQQMLRLGFPIMDNYLDFFDKLLKLDIS